MQLKQSSAGRSSTPQKLTMRFLSLLRWRLPALLLLRWLHALLQPTLGRRPAFCGLTCSSGASRLRRRMGLGRGAG